LILQKNLLIFLPQHGRRSQPCCGEKMVIWGRLRLPKPLFLEDELR
jgi:hypothetical protein